MIFSIITKHIRTQRRQIADAVFHGTDLDCGHSAYLALVKAVKDGIITEKQLDVSVKRLFTIRFRLGLFDPVELVDYARIPISILECRKHQDLAKQLARESMVLLKTTSYFRSKRIN